MTAKMERWRKMWNRQQRRRVGPPEVKVMKAMDEQQDLYADAIVPFPDAQAEQDTFRPCKGAGKSRRKRRRRKRRTPKTEQQFMKIDVFTMAGEPVQSVLVPSTILGRELLDMVLPAQAHHGSVAKLLHGVSAINKSAPISAQGITDCAWLTLLRIPISEQRRDAVVRKVISVL